MIKTRKTIITFLTLLSISFLIGEAYGWDKTKTHNNISISAIDNSKISYEYLKTLGLYFYSDPLEEITRLIIQGSKEEDEGGILLIDARVQNHFHEPLSNSGLDRWYFLPRPVPFWYHLTGESSKLWAQNANNEWSWEHIRDYYFEALTAGEEEVRQESFKKTFKGVGHQIHLVQDLAQPAHVRNDPHPMDAFGFPEGFESWAISKENELKVSQLLFATEPIRPSKSLLDLSPGLFPIGSLWDSNQYNGLNPSGGTAVGLAEYTSANFFSEDTINAREFPFPQIIDIIPTTIKTIENPNIGSTYEREYYLKTCCGETKGGQGYLLAAKDALGYYHKKYNVPEGLRLTYPILDDNVYEEYAQFLLPRAVGYSTEIINYFFRGRMEVAGGLFTDASRKAVKLRVANTTPNEAATGFVTVAARYRLNGDDEVHSRVSGAVDAETLKSTLAESDPFTFEFTESIPEDAEDLEFIVAFEGTLGAEQDTAVMGLRHIPEPFVFAIQEEVQLNGTLYSDTLFCSDSAECPQDSVLGKYHARDRTLNYYDIFHQKFSGRFEVIGGAKIAGVYTRGNLFINDQPIEGGLWRPGDTPDPPKTWRVEVNPYQFTRDLDIQLDDGSVYTLTMAFFNILDQRGEKAFQTYWQKPGGWISSYAEARINLEFAHYSTPDQNLLGFFHYNRVQIGGASNGFTDPPIDEWWTDNDGFVYHLLGSNRLNLGPKSYKRATSSSCGPCGRSLSEEYEKLTTPSPHALNTTAEYEGAFPQEDLDYLHSKGIEPPENTGLIFRP